jgi:hypothetical protein
MAGRIVSQIDQARSSNQKIVGYFRECSENAGLDSNIRRRIGCHHQKVSQYRGSLYALLQAYSVTLLKKPLLNSGLLENVNSPEDNMFENQLSLFGS